MGDIMTSFVLVHGAWNGGWCWKRVAPLLRVAGHEVYTPTLTGLGERVHLATPEVGLDTHTRDIVNLLEFEDLERVVLVGHSFGGVTITAVADQVPDRIRHLVYLDAVVPLDGESQFDSMDLQARAALEEQARAAGDGWRVPSPIVDDLPSEADNQWITSRLTPQPLKTYQDRFQLANAAALALPKTYVYCTRSWMAPHAERARRAGWDYRELDTEHLCYATAPRKVADLLRSLI
jgi:pimeloyl-ACP methyl ester carboxylesterase